MLIGLQLFDGDAAANRRQHLAVAALCALDSVGVVNLQFRDGAPCVDPRVESVPVLKQDSSTVTAAPGPRKPISLEVFDTLAELARARGFDHFAYINSDIVVTRSVPEIVASGGLDTYAVSRADVDARQAEPAMLTAGLDMFIVAHEWWRSQGTRFRPYIVGEMCWDVVYVAMMLCHSNGRLLNRQPLILHERHESTWQAPTPFARYNGMLAALDARYFSMWCQYWNQLEALRARGACEQEEQRLQQRAFAWKRSPVEAVKQVARSAKARLRYERLQRAWAG